VSSWNWKPEPRRGIWRYGAEWMRPMVASAPYLCVILCLVMLGFVGGTMMRNPGVVFDLPDSGVDEGELTGLVALVVPLANDTMVFFDDSRYMVSEAGWKDSFLEHLSDQAARREQHSLMVLADRRVSAEVLMNLASIAKRSGIAKVMFAEKREVTEE